MVEVNPAVSVGTVENETLNLATDEGESPRGEDGAIYNFRSQSSKRERSKMT